MGNASRDADEKDVLLGRPRGFVARRLYLLPGVSTPGC